MRHHQSESGRWFGAHFGGRWPLLGMVHLPPLPGSPRHETELPGIRAAAMADAITLLEAGFDGLIIENFGDAPFFPDVVEPHTIAAMSIIVAEIVSVALRHAPDRPAPVGVNVLRNDARSAMAIAAMSGAAFIRVNVHCGAMLTDQGLIQGQAHHTLRYRQQLGAQVGILADVMVKHAVPLGPLTLESSARDTLERGQADGLVLSGDGTGLPTDLERVRKLRTMLPGAPLWIGSGLTESTLQSTMHVASGAIVGTAIKEGADPNLPVDAARARSLVTLRDEIWASMGR